jgi:hypothetical protein
MKKISILLAAAVLSTGLWSCGGDENHDHDGKDTTATTNDTMSVEDETGPTDSYLLPSPLQIAYIFKKSGLKYQAGIANDVKKEASYSGSYEQSLGLGIYSSDLAYCVLNKQKQEAISYMNAVKALSDKLGMSTVFDSESLLKRFEANVVNEDSVMFILSDIQSRSDEFFSSNDRQMSAAVVFSGAWVESMYIASKILPKTKDSKMADQLADQLGILENLLKELANHKDKEPAIANLITQLETVQGIITSIPGVKEMMESEKPQDVKISASEEQLKTLAAKLEEIRTAMVK